MDTCMHSLSPFIASGVKLFFWEKQWRGAYRAEICGNRAAMPETIVPLTHVPVQAQSTQHFRLESGGASQCARKRGPLLTELTGSF